MSARSKLVIRKLSDRPRRIMQHKGRYVIDANSPTFGADLQYAFAEAVKKAAREYHARSRENA